MLNITLPSIQNLPVPNLSIINLPPIISSSSAGQTSSQPTKLLSCSHCSTTFSRKNSLIRHMRIHTGYKPYSCKACNKNFSRKDILDKHKDSLRCLRNTQFPLVHNNSYASLLSSSPNSQSAMTRSSSPGLIDSRMSINSILSDSDNFIEFNSELNYTPGLFY